MEKKRLLGLTILGIGLILLGLLFLLMMPLFSILYLFTGVSILFLKPFARYLAIATSVLGIIVNTINLIKFINKGLTTQIIIALIGTYLIHVCIIYYLTLPRVKEQFN